MEKGKVSDICEATSLLCILVYNPLNPHIGIHILHSVLCTPLLELTRNCV